MESHQSSKSLSPDIIERASPASSSEDAPQMESPSPSLTSSASTVTSSSEQTSDPTRTLMPQDPEAELPRPGDVQEEIMTSKLLDINITFSNDSEKIREQNKSKNLPRFFYRTAYETSITLSSYTSKDTHSKHREQPHLKIAPENAFQAVSAFDLPKDLNKERIERHLKWNKKLDPSSYISAFNDISHAKRRANWHYEVSQHTQRIGHRVFIAQIRTNGLVAATVSAVCETTVKVVTKRKFQRELIKITDHKFIVNIPVWIRDPRRSDSRVNLSAEEFADLGAEMWISITELRKSNLRDGPKSTIKRPINYICADGHDYEWLACGAIPKACILHVMPFDGRELHTQQTTRIIKSIYSTEPWVWNWERTRWVLDSALFSIAEGRDAELQQARQVRKRGARDVVDQEPNHPSKRPKMIEVTLVRPYLNLKASR